MKKIFKGRYDSTIVPLCELKEICFSNSKHILQEKIFSREFPLNYQEILSIDFPDEFRWSQKLYHYLENDNELKLGHCGHPNCNNRCTFNSVIRGYNQYCSRKCQGSAPERLNNCRKTSMLHFGTDYPMQCDEMRGKASNTYKNKSQEEKNAIKEKTKRTLELNPDILIKSVNKRREFYKLHPDVKERMDNNLKETWKNKSKEEIDKFTEYCLSQNELKNGSRYYNNPQKIKEVYQSKSDDEKNERKLKISETKLSRSNEEKKLITIKAFNTKRNNGTINTSKAERDVEEWLNLKNIRYKKNFISGIYPFHVDFYLIDYDLYIEIQGHWSHGGHPFNPTNEGDINTLNKWIEKSNDSEYYKNAIEVWTVRDVLKRETAKKNELKYFEIFSKCGKDVINYIDNILRNI